jgi:hypothetical protein
MSAKDLLKKAEELIAEAMGTTETQTAAPNAAPAGTVQTVGTATPVTTQPSVLETTLEVARIMKAQNAQP